MYKINIMGPRMEPCGTPCLIDVQLGDCYNGVTYYILKLSDICL